MPTPENVVCRGCGVNSPSDQHVCSPKCALCGGPHPTADKSYKQRYQVPYIVRQRRKERHDYNQDFPPMGPLSRPAVPPRAGSGSGAGHNQGALERAIQGPTAAGCLRGPLSLRGAARAPGVGGSHPEACCPGDRVGRSRHRIPDTTNGGAAGKAGGSTLIVAGDFNAPHRACGYSRAMRKGDDLWQAAANHDLTLVTNPAFPTRIGNSCSRDTAKNLTFVKNVGAVSWHNLTKI
ncbi:hypothetical protein HPB47_009226 [Ixodes persulcatus]|uniref:Uncharacterized protein n=1 Tax=Ixodes persulcatus TaxID=34615 RepID=A0AC60P2T9_IXOPE|nr:hypothetical protein HPB47_009226 [Ixodes persulcatus]